MQFVGPRPEDPRYVSHYSNEQLKVLDVLPGITSAASFAYRDEEDLLAGSDWEQRYRTIIMPAKIRIDLDYLANRGVLQDVKLIVLSLLAMIPVDSRRLRNRLFFITDILMFPLAIYASFVLRLDTVVIFPEFSLGYTVLLAIAMLVIPVVLFRSGVYSRYWPFASPNEFLSLFGAMTIASLATAAVSIALIALLGYSLVGAVLPRSVPLIFMLVVTLMVATPRILVRLLYGQKLSEVVGYFWRRSDRVGTLAPSNTLIVGAGGVGARLAREMRLNTRWGMRAVGFLDDDASKHGLKIQGVPVLGACADLTRIVAGYDVQQVIIAMSLAPGKVVREIVGLCNTAKVPVKVMPGINEVLDGKVNVSKLRNVDIEDLLRRAPVQTDVAAVGDLIRGRRVLVTGGGGSIGSELCRQIAAFGPAELVLVGHGENSIFEIQNELAPLAADHATELIGVIADIRFADRVSSLVRQHRPHVIFHAAAHKHVPLMELNPAEAVTNNVVGTRNLLLAAHENGVEAFVMISTDKAVNPSSIMGASKRTAELLMRQFATRPDCKTRFCAVRFGNVLGSRGSVVLTFKKQIAQGGPVTVTHPDMKRYFMTIPEAVQLVMQASVLSKNGEIFVLDMGEPVKISDLARDLIRLSGLEVGADIEIRYSGLRPGEKLFEELFLEDESYQRTRHEKIFVAANAAAQVPEQLMVMVARLEDAARRNDRDEIVRLFHAIVPEYRPTDAVVSPPVGTAEKRMHAGTHAGLANAAA